MNAIQGDNDITKEIKLLMDGLVIADLLEKQVDLAQVGRTLARAVAEIRELRRRVKHYQDINNGD